MNNKKYKSMAYIKNWNKKNIMIRSYAIAILIGKVQKHKTAFCKKSLESAPFTFRFVYDLPNCVNNRLNQ